jgi:exopolysaccharide production protein ExoZ
VVVHYITWDIQVLGERHGLTIAIQRTFPFDSGVDQFFVISGFITAYTVRDQFGLPRASLSFLRRRLIRIVPLYWATTTLFALIVVLIPSGVSTPAPTSTQYVLSLIFMPYAPSAGSVSPVFPLGWTLNYEMLFYVLFAVTLLGALSVGLALLGAIFVILVALNIAWTLPEPFGFWGNPLS